MKLYDQNGDECQMTGLPHMFYDKVAVDDRIAELEREIEQQKQREMNAKCSRCGHTLFTTGPL